MTAKRFRFRAGVALFVLLATLSGRSSNKSASAQEAEETLPSQSVETPDDVSPGINVFLELLTTDISVASRALRAIEASWEPGSTVMLVELLRLSRNPLVARRIASSLSRRTEGSTSYDLGDWYQVIWKNEYRPHRDYAEFKSKLYSRIDPRFGEYFDVERTATIRLDEIRWGGVVRDGIPPLKDPKMVSAEEASYLDDSDVVFALETNGDARAYPKRILAWHEMVKDSIGGESLVGVYCTLCGSMIVYSTEVDGEHHELGTSGFLYRSNKLMYDHETKSLWSTLTGTPVVGPLAGKGIELGLRHVVTTTWGEWRRRHPDTKVLSLETGHERDYREGIAYRNYFATDELMFDVPTIDGRLLNKAEVLALRVEGLDEQLAIATAYLSEHPIYHDRIGDRDFVVLTDASGANRIYEAKGRRFDSWDGKYTAIDSGGQAWTLTESKLLGPDSTSLNRLPGHRAFWFGWFAAYPETRLVK